MDKLNLNNEIVLCRSLVRAAKVILIRKNVRNIKILKKCKNPDQNIVTKKARKLERLVEQTNILKHIKEDEVTKFALRNSDLSCFIKDLNIVNPEHVYAKIASSPKLKSKIQDIRSRVPNSEKELPFLLDALGKRSAKKKQKKLQREAENDLGSEVVKSNDVLDSEVNVELKSDSIETRGEKNKVDEITGNNTDSPNNRINKLRIDSSNLGKIAKKTQFTKNKKMLGQPSKTESDEAITDIDTEEKLKTKSKRVNKETEPLSDEELSEESEIQINSKNTANFPSVSNKIDPNINRQRLGTNKATKKHMLKSNTTHTDDETVKPKKVKVKNVKEKTESCNESGFFINVAKGVPIETSKDPENTEEKIDDPFFVNKKVTKPKLDVEETEDDDQNFKIENQANFYREQRKQFSHSGPPRSSFPQSYRNEGFNNFKEGGYVEERVSVQKREKETELHPSWLAKKKNSTIIPFEGKKIKFD